MSMLFSEPAVRPTDISLRPYQLEAIEGIGRAFAEGNRSTLLVLPTGLGKTITFGSFIRRHVQEGGRALVLAHRGELIEQAFEAMVRLGLDPAIEKAQQYARAMCDPSVVIATVQTLQRDRLAGWPTDYFSLVVTDEAHHATADTYRRIYSHFGDALHLGVTATADRSDETFLGDVFQSVAYDMSLWEAMTAPSPGPYLCRLRFVQCDVGIDLRDIRTTGGDFNQGDLEEAIRPHVEALANAIRQEVGDRQTLVFTPDVGSAQAMATAVDSLGLKARWSSGDDPDRKAKVAEYKSGEIQVLANCNLFTEGFDAPRTSAVVLCRPTKSRPLYAQMVGRGTRLAPNKTDCLIVDFNWLTRDHDLVVPVELFDTTHTDSEVLDIAREMMTRQRGLDLVDILEEASTEQRRRKVLRIAAKQREMRYRKVVYDPVSTMEVLGVPVRREAKSMQGTATSGQQDALRRFGIEGVETMSKRSASMLLDQLITRAKQGLATQKQVAHLIRLGYDPAEARSLRREEASAELARHWGAR